MMYNLLLTVCVVLSTLEPAVSHEAADDLSVPTNLQLQDPLIGLIVNKLTMLTNLTKEIKSLKKKSESDKADMLNMKADMLNMKADMLNMKIKLESAKRKMKATEDDLKKEQKESAKNMIDAQTKIATLSTNQTKIMKNIAANTKNAVKLVGGRIPQNLLPGSYATATLEDVQWQAVHLAAGAACGGSFNKIRNHVYPATGGKSCKETCAKTWLSCYYSVRLWAVSGKLTRFKVIAVQNSWGCDSKIPTGYDEVAADGKSAAKVIDMQYCCCT